MSLFFLSGGGRYGNQLINFYHLLSISIEHKLKIYKLNDSSFINYNKFLPFININISKKNTFQTNLQERPRKIEYFFKIYYRFVIYFLHAFFYLIPNLRSYKFKPHLERDKFLIAEKVDLDNQLNKFIKNTKKYQSVFSGYGLRNYELLKKHKKKISAYMLDQLIKDLNIKNLEYFDNDFLFVHIRRTDFKNVPAYKDINFENKQWIESILKLTRKKQVRNVVVFSDEKINQKFLIKLRSKKLIVLVPENVYQISFIKLFFNYIKNAKYVLCNASSLSISLSFLIREYIYIPSKTDVYKKLTFSKLFEDTYYSNFF